MAVYLQRYDKQTPINTRRLNGLTSAAAFKVLFELVHRMDDDGVVTLVASSRKTICKVVDLHETYLTFVLEILRKHRLITGTRNTFTINPELLQAS